MIFTSVNFDFVRRSLAFAGAILALVVIGFGSASAQDVMTHEELMRRARGLPPLKTTTNPPPQVVAQPAPPTASPVMRFPAAPNKPTPTEVAPPIVRPPVIAVAAKPAESSPAPAPEPRKPKSKPSGFSEVPPDFYKTSATAKTTSGSAPISTTNTNAMTALDDKHQLAIGDRLSFRIIEDEEDPRPLVVMDSGELEVPYLGRFSAAGKSCKELAVALKAELEKEYYFRATVILAVDSMARSRGKVYLVGPVRMPGPQEIPSDEVLTLSKAILRAGGFTDFADKKTVKVTRKHTETGVEDESFSINVGEILEQGRTEADLPLRPGDLVYIQERLIRF